MAQAAGTAFPLGAFFGAPDGSDSGNMAWFKSNYDMFAGILGAHPKYYDFFTDYTHDPSDWVANASYGAWSGAQSGADYVAPSSGTIPVVGVPMAAEDTGNAAVDTFYKTIIAGSEDSVYRGIVDQYAGNGYTTVQFRVGWEFNGSWEPWAPGGASDAGAAVNADFVAAFQHIAGLIHSESDKDSITGQVVWNPAVFSYQTGTNGAAITSLYPGNAAVDVISADQYSNAYPLDLTDWATGGTKQDASYAQWVANPLNREHFWQTPDATQASPNGTGHGLSLDDLIALAKANGKPISLSETGAGGDGRTGPADDPYFAQWLAQELASAEQQGVQVSNVNIWSLDSNGDDSFVNPNATTGAPERPLEAAAFARYFGAGSTVALDANALGGSTSGGSTSGGSTATSTGGTTAAPATATFSDNSGATLGAVAIVTSGASEMDAYQTGLDGNVSESVSGGVTTISTPSFGLVDQLSLTDTAGRSFSLHNFLSIDLQLSGGATTASVTASIVQNGTIAIGSGSYDLTVNALSGGGDASQNLFRVTLGGSGDDTLTMSGHAGITQASVQAGSGSDTMTFANMGAVSVTGGSGSDVIVGGNYGNDITVGSGAMEVTGGSGIDIYEYHAGSGMLAVDDFVFGRDQIWLDTSLASSLQQVQTSGGLALDFNGSTTPAILLRGVDAIATADLRWQ